MGRIIDEDKVISIIERQPNYNDYWNNVTDMRDGIKELPEVDALDWKKIDEILDKFSKWLWSESESVRGDNMIDISYAEDHLRELFDWERKWEE